MNKIALGVYAPFYQTYIDKVDGDPVALLEIQQKDFQQYIKDNAGRLSHRYEKDKWTIRQVIMHIIDTEHVFGYRLLRISRGDKTPLPGFDQDVFMEGNDFSHLDGNDLLDLFNTHRAATITFIKSLNKSQLNSVGQASGNEVSAGALVYMIAGHAQHHYQILKERYL